MTNTIYFMIFRLSSFLTLALALALFSLDAVTAILVPRSVDDELQIRDESRWVGVNADITYYGSGAWA